MRRRRSDIDAVTEADPEAQRSDVADETEDQANQPGRLAGTTVLCVAGRGPLDDVVCAILAQVLRKHGLSARAVPNEAASRNGIARLDAGGVAIAYQVLGEGPRNLVVAPGFISHVELMWEQPMVRRFMHRLASYN